MGLREKRKQNTRKSIVSSARQLFVTTGYKAVSMEKVAERADVAVGTLYNYFRSKSEIMLAVAVQDTHGLMIPLSHSELNSLTIEDLIEVFTHRLVKFVSSYPRKLLKELAGVFWEAGQEKLSTGLVSLDVQIMGQISHVVSVLKKSGRLRENTDPQIAALALYGMVTTTVMWYSIDPEFALEKVGTVVSEMIRHFCRGILPSEKEKRCTT
jgi:AcrR family transcriptional regulator